ncbi:hypothetical protein [Rhizobium oryzicola]|uniref:Uncharacterized protein n=1 Tax=Rhizobium oryzicola TaxID=1232668 RepID=A0ABT8SYL9_9HYPH|nr:hypothetical protein [Rhizobium oryzicola]MDO1582983.1 hypothetical protein [Rhizobium oryzicola]
MNANKTISAHKFIEYAFASPQKRVTIIENALQPPTFIMDTMYPDIERATAHFLVSGCKDPKRLDGLDKSYQLREASSDHHEQRLLNALDAIQHVKSAPWSLKDYAVEFAVDIPHGIEVGGITIRIKAPVILKRRQSGFRDPFIGVIKPYFGKVWPLNSGQDTERGVLFATLLHWFSEQNLSHLGSSDPNMCIVADVFREEMFPAAKRNIQRRKQLQALAQEIADRWQPIADRLHSRTSSGSTATKE